MFVDLRSDTVTRPCAAMREAMARAEVGDDVYGDDPTVTALEERVADMFGHEAAVFTPTGSLSNQLGLRLHVSPGGELVTDSAAHVLRAELGAAAAFSGITSRSWVAPYGVFRNADAEAIMQPDAGPYLVSTQLVCVENTHNFGGGTIQSLQELTALRDLTRSHGIGTHLDGARIWNALVATGESPREHGALFDTVSVCFSKGLGAPVGSALLGSAEAIAEARVWRKRYGAGMRQAGIVAAGALYALEHNMDRLADDHRRTHEVAVAAAQVCPDVVDPEKAPTNILPLKVSALGWDAEEFVAAARDAGVACQRVAPGVVRFVWHLDIDDAQTAHAKQVIVNLLAHKAD